MLKLAVLVAVLALLVPSGFASTCGNGIVEGAEVCDTGKTYTTNPYRTDNGDGCNPTCTAVSTGWYSCTGTAPSVCTGCGDGVIQAAHGETCDDGNQISGDGCSSLCKTESVLNANAAICTSSNGVDTSRQCANILGAPDAGWASATTKVWEPQMCLPLDGFGFQTSGNSTCSTLNLDLKWASSQAATALQIYLCNRLYINTATFFSSSNLALKVYSSNTAFASAFTVFESAWNQSSPRTPGVCSGITLQFTAGTAAAFSQLRIQFTNTAGFRDLVVDAVRMWY
eukprot:gnl/Hemi2/20667_TR6849_c0_g1_i1.p1 gnl/Hemi2/20667_TR6849_c0_g1~~gnl/Hemi2/20667_TR6849_c0_g1_i1.p1  ORF type:complete len:284 (+),score=67.45 gnl/Hemi2/20667_TR6849_c0_g1_i1:161-1012(+)